MQYTTIDGNGTFPLTDKNAADYKEASIYAPADIGAATIAIGWLDAESTFNAYADGALLAGEASKFSCGTGADVVAQIAGYSTSFKIGFAG